MPIHFTLIITQPFPGVTYALQKGKTSEHQTLQSQTGGDKDLVFEFDCETKPGDEGTIICTGPFCQGPPKERFVYINIGSYGGQAGTSFNGRMKIPLTGITETMLTDGKLQTKVPGTAKSGKTPNYATVKPFDGWK